MSTFPAVMPASRIPDPAQAPALRWGIIGPGWIATQLTASLQRWTGQQVTAVASRSSDRALAFAGRFGIDRAYGDYARLVADPGVDVVYVASPHSEHAAHALLAIEAGKHVLVEKAFTRNATEARAVIDAARAAGVLVQEAMWTRFLPHVDVVRQLLADGALGEVQTVVADHGQWFAPDATSRLFDPALAGGALLDLGIYPLSFASFVLGRPQSVSAVGTLAFTGVDAQVSAVLPAPSGAHALISTTLAAKTPTTATISGTLARVELAGDFYSPSSVTLLGRDGQRLVWDANPVPGHEALCFQASAVARLVAEGATESPLLPVAETLAIMETADDIRRQVGVRYPGE